MYMGASHTQQKTNTKQSLTTTLSFILACAAGGAVAQLAQCDYRGYISENDCPAGSRGYVGGTITVGFCTQAPNFPVAGVKVTEITPCPLPGQTLLLDVSEELCGNFTTVRTFTADGGCTNVSGEGLVVLALRARCV